MKTFKNKINLKSKKVADKSAQWNKLRQLFSTEWTIIWRLVRTGGDIYGSFLGHRMNIYMSDGVRVTVQLRAPKYLPATGGFGNAAPGLQFSPVFLPFAVMKWWQRHLWWTLCRISRQLPLQAMSTKLMRNFYFNLSFCQRRKFGSRLIC